MKMRIATRGARRKRIRMNARLVVLLLVLASCRGFLPTTMTTTTKPRHRPARNARNAADDEPLDLHLLLIDHYDSFTYNLVDLLAQYCVEPPLVVAADRCTSWEELQELLVLEGNHENAQAPFDGIVLSPGPGNPSSCGPLAASVVAAHPQTPVLGVCLGHQILGTLYGATCEQAPTPVHGQAHALDFRAHDGGDEHDPLWQGAWQRLQSSGLDAASARHWQVTRYHSLHVTELEGTPLIPTAYTTRETKDEEEPLLMALRHVDRPHFGVQFHPESVGSRHGWALVKSFCQLCRDYQPQRIAAAPHPPPRLGTDLLLPAKNGKAARQGTGSVRNGHTTAAALRNAVDQTLDSSNVRVLVHRIGSSSRMEAINVMEELLGEESYRYWLDTADAHQRVGAISVLGGATHRVEYWGREHDPTIRPRGVYVYEEDAGQGAQYSNLDILTYLESQQAHSMPSATWVSWDDEGQAVLRSASDEGETNPPFAFWGGFVGYLGYEVRYDTADYLAKVEGGPPRSRPTTQPPSTTPTAAFLRADRSYVYHHDRKEWYLVVNLLGRHPEAEEEALRWIQRQSRLVREWQPSRMLRSDDRPHQRPANRARFRPNRSRDRYNDNFDTCLEQIRKGESYELCLTNQLESTVPRGSPLDLYKILRRRNAAPHSAFFDWNSNEKEQHGSSFAVCCSSPERFVSVLPDSDGTVHVEAKPIKGTCARVLPLNGRDTRNKAEDREDLERAMDLRSSVKNRAENLMIVDLLRNDLSRVCQTGSVHVAKLMDIESFATVHQMVSTIRGTLDTTRHSVISVLRTCFPGGSMTGAPKLRTMAILHELEEGVPRGLYAGCMGYIGSNGAMDMNIIIRTAVLTPSKQMDSWDISVGAGGAITILSESEDEYEEMILKATAILDAVDEWSVPYPSYRGGANATVASGRLAVVVPSSGPQ